MKFWIKENIYTNAHMVETDHYTMALMSIYAGEAARRYRQMNCEALAKTAEFNADAIFHQLQLVDHYNCVQSEEETREAKVVAKNWLKENIPEVF